MLNNPYRDAGRTQGGGAGFDALNQSLYPNIGGANPDGPSGVGSIRDRLRNRRGGGFNPGAMRGAPAPTPVPSPPMRPPTLPPPSIGGVGRSAGIVQPPVPAVPPVSLQPQPPVSNPQAIPTLLASLYRGGGMRRF